MRISLAAAVLTLVAGLLGVGQSTAHGQDYGAYGQEYGAYAYAPPVGNRALVVAQHRAMQGAVQPAGHRAADECGPGVLGTGSHLRGLGVGHGGGYAPAGHGYGPAGHHNGGRYGHFGGAHRTPGYPYAHHREYVGPPGPPSAQVAYPYYTIRGPRDFLIDNPPSIGR